MEQARIRLVSSRSLARPDDWRENRPRSNDWPRPLPVKSNALIVKVNLLILQRPRLTRFVESVVDELLKRA